MKKFLMIPVLVVAAVPAVLFLAGCFESMDQGMPEQVNSYTNTVTVEGRVFYYAVPPAMKHSGGYPVIFCFHGGDGSGTLWLNFTGIGLSGFGNMALANGYFVVAPESGISDDPSGSYSDVKKRWDVSLASGDIPYIMNILEWLASSGYPVNMNRIFGVGISSGGAMVSRLCQSTPGTFRRVALVATINPNYGYIPATQVVNNDHPSALFVQGDADPLTPYARALDYYGNVGGFGTNGLSDSHGLASGVNDNSVSFIRYFITVPGGGHIWFRDHNIDIIDWFEAGM
jgi:poly(3-hydroxybutyrate) depolymerase